MKIKVTKKFKIRPGVYLQPTGNVITVLDDLGYRAVKSGCAISVDKPELNPKKVETKNNKKEK